MTDSSIDPELTEPRIAIGPTHSSAVGGEPPVPPHPPIGEGDQEEPEPRDSLEKEIFEGLVDYLANSPDLSSEAGIGLLIDEIRIEFPDIDIPNNLSLRQQLVRLVRECSPLPGGLAELARKIALTDSRWHRVPEVRRGSDVIMEWVAPGVSRRYATAVQPRRRRTRMQTGV